MNCRKEVISASYVQHATRVRQRGSVYLTVIGASAIVMIIGVSAIMAVRVQGRTVALNSDVIAARNHAQSAIEWGRLMIARDDQWRTTRGAGVWLADMPIGDGSMSLTVLDPVDENIANSKYDRVRLIGTGVQGRAVQTLQVDLDPITTMPTALNSALHAQQRIYAKKPLIVIGGPSSSNGNFRRDVPVVTDVQAATLSGSGAITGIVTVPAQSRTMPDADVIEAYIGIATTFATPGNSNMDRFVMSPGNNPWGATNPQGVYYISHSSDLRIREGRIHGTLIVRVPPGRKLILDRQVFFHAYRSDYPVLIVDGDLELRNDGEDAVLSENATSTNFNPSHSPYNGQSNNNQSDVYPAEIQGLVYVRGNVQVTKTPIIRGLLICEGEVLVDDSLTVIHDKTYANPWHFESVTGMRIVPGSWQRPLSP